MTSIKTKTKPKSSGDDEEKQPVAAGKTNGVAKKRTQKAVVSEEEGEEENASSTPTKSMPIKKKPRAADAEEDSEPIPLAKDQGNGKEGADKEPLEAKATKTTKASTKRKATDDTTTTASVRRTKPAAKVTRKPKDPDNGEEDSEGPLLKATKRKPKDPDNGEEDSEGPLLKTAQTKRKPKDPDNGDEDTHEEKKVAKARRKPRDPDNGDDDNTNEEAEGPAMPLTKARRKPKDPDNGDDDNANEEAEGTAMPSTKARRKPKDPDNGDEDDNVHDDKETFATPLSKAQPKGAHDDTAPKALATPSVRLATSASAMIKGASPFDLLTVHGAAPVGPLQPPPPKVETVDHFQIGQSDEPSLASRVRPFATPGTPFSVSLPSPVAPSSTFPSSPTTFQPSPPLASPFSPPASLFPAHGFPNLARAAQPNRALALPSRVAVPPLSRSSTGPAVSAAPSSAGPSGRTPYGMGLGPIKFSEKMRFLATREPQPMCLGDPSKECDATQSLNLISEVYANPHRPYKESDPFKRTIPYPMPISLTRDHLPPSSATTQTAQNDFGRRWVSPKVNGERIELHARVVKGKLQTFRGFTRANNVYPKLDLQDGNCDIGASPVWLKLEGDSLFTAEVMHVPQPGGTSDLRVIIIMDTAMVGGKDLRHEPFYKRWNAVCEIVSELNTNRFEGPLGNESQCKKFVVNSQAVQIVWKPFYDMRDLPTLLQRMVHTTALERIFMLDAEADTPLYPEDRRNGSILHYPANAIPCDGLIFQAPFATAMERDQTLKYRWKPTVDLNLDKAEHAALGVDLSLSVLVHCTREAGEAKDHCVPLYNGRVLDPVVLERIKSFARPHHPLVVECVPSNRGDFLIVGVRDPREKSTPNAIKTVAGILLGYHEPITEQEILATKYRVFGV
jgi:hypothetical protein